MNGVISSRIPYIAAVNGRRVDAITGCGNSRDICAVRYECWARRDAEHKHMVSGGARLCDSFIPTFHPEALSAVRRLRKPTTLFWDLGGDRCSAGVDSDWRRQEYAVMAQTPQHTHVTLTKAWIPEFKNEPGIELPNLWCGASVTDNDSLHNWLCLPFFDEDDRWKTHWWFSFEPLLGQINKVYICTGAVRFVVIGGLSDGVGRIIPPNKEGTRAEWVAPIIEAAHEAKCGIFLKNLPKPIITQITNPRTGRKFESMFEMRDVPKEWVHD